MRQKKEISKTNFRNVVVFCKVCPRLLKFNRVENSEQRKRDKKDEKRI